MNVPFIAYGYLYQYFPLLKKESVACNKSHENLNLSKTFRNYKQPKYTYKGTKKVCGLDKPKIEMQIWTTC